MQPPSPGAWLRSPRYPSAQPETHPTSPVLSTSGPRRPIGKLFSDNCAIILAFLGILLAGIPVAAGTKDERCLDAFVIWFIWALMVRLQLLFKTSSALRSKPKVKSVLATLMNPVLGTTLLLICYTRSKAALKHGGLKEVLETLSSGTPLYALLTSRVTRKRLPKYARWISQVTNKRLPKNRKDWFGAGDLALSLLECGLFTWGFKLYECRRQLFSTKGFTVTVVCVGAAAANVFLSVFIAHSLALAAPESLAFSTRSTTLALSKPAITAVGGNVAVNAMIVVSNGILGQLMFPFVLDRLGVQRHPPNSNTREVAVELQPVSRWSDSTEGETSGTAGEDNVMTVAAGVTSGINSAAMGVSYMYETNSRAAPYTALSMVVFGVVTVVLTTVEPFKAMVTRIAKG